VILAMPGTVIGRRLRILLPEPPAQSNQSCPPESPKKRDGESHRRPFIRQMNDG
jgi:hypothetical protein